MKALLAAFAYFSVLPVGRTATLAPPDGATLAFLPIVGVVIGALAGGIGWGGSFFLPHSIAVILCFGASIALTGALHFDGLLDSADALFASVDPARRFEILKDPRHGTFAVATGLVTSALWIAALEATPVGRLVATVAFAAGVARFGAVMNAYRYPYGAGGASAKVFERRPSLTILILTGCVLALLATQVTLASALAACLAVPIALVLGGWASARLGGSLVGDVYGGIIVVLEVLVLATAGIGAA